MKPLLLILSIALTYAWAAEAESTSFTMVAAGTDTMPIVSDEPAAFNFGSKYGFGAGILLDLAFSEDETISFGAIYLMREFSDGINSVNAQDIDFSALYRLWWGDAALGAGAFYGFGTSLSANATDKSYKDYGIKTGDFGPVFSATYKMPMDAGRSLLIEGRYEVDATNIAVSSQEKFRFQEVILLLGYSFGGSSSGGAR